MRNWLTLLTTVFVGSTLSLSAMDARSYLEFDAAYRHDDASWKFFAPSPDPLLEDKISFKDVNIFQIGVQGKTTFDCIMIRALADYGWVLDGNADETLTAFASGVDEDDVMNGESSINVDHILDGRYVADLSIAIGYPFYFCDCTASLSPVIGYSYATQSYKVDRNFRTFFTPPTTPGNTPGISDEDEDGTDHYVQSWYGPFIGLDFTYSADCCLSFYGQFEYHWAQFTGKRDSFIGIDPIDDYHHTTDKAHGAIVRLGINYLFCDCWYAGINATYQDWRAHKSSDLGNELAEDGFAAPVIGGRSDDMRCQAKVHSFSAGIAVGKTF